MGRLRVLSRSGDNTVVWDTTPGAEEAVRQAERIFNEHRSAGATAFRVVDDEPAERLDAFDPAAEQIVIVPRLAGG